MHYTLFLRCTLAWVMAALAFGAHAQKLAPPAWDMEAITASRTVHPTPSHPAAPAPALAGVDTTKLLIVVQTDGRQLHLIDGTHWRSVGHMALPWALHGKPAFSPEGRFLFYAAREGWIVKIDLHQLQAVAQVRAGQQTNALALSDDGHYLAVANEAPHTLVLLNSALEPLKVHHGLNKERTRSSRIAHIATAPARRSFVATLQDVPEVWEVSYNPLADDVPIGVIHDFLYKEGAFIRGFLNPQRSYLAESLGHFVLTPQGDELLSTGQHTGQSLVMHLDVRKKIAQPSLPQGIDLPAAAAWMPPGSTSAWLALPQAGTGRLQVLDLEHWSPITLAAPATTGPLLRSHARSPYVWATLPAPEDDTLQALDPRTLQPVLRLRPTPGQAIADLAWSHHGEHLLASLPSAQGGSLVVFDARSGREITRTPLAQPAGIYPVPALAR